VLIDFRRREKRKKRTAPTSRPKLVEEPTDESPTPEESAQKEEARREVLEVLRSLPEEYRLPITLRYIAGADYKTIGKQLGLSNGSLRGLLNRGMAQLRAAFKSEEVL
jgi:RNA polymerase sigma-70 factor (ECF subfamily)